MKKIIGSFVAFLCLLSSVSFAEEYRLYAAAGIKIPIIELSKDYQTTSGHVIVNDFDTAGAAEKKFLADPGASFLITTQGRIDKAISNKTLVNGTAIHLVNTAAGIASSMSQKPTIRTPDDLKAALLAARTIAFSDPARGATVGLHFVKVLQSLGIEKEIMAKAVIARDGIETMKLILEKKVDLGITQISEIVQADRTTLVGPFPPGLALESQYTLWYKANGNAGLEGFVKLLTSAKASENFDKHGLIPAIKP